MITEGSIQLPLEQPKKISRALPVFYNPVMALNRTISLLVLRTWKKNHLRIGLPLAGTGIRGMRMLKELPEEKVKEIIFNDLDPKAGAFIQQTAKLNAIPQQYRIKNTEANVFLLQEKPFDYLDLDPFGSPNPFLDAAIKRMKQEGILAVTATDTAPLAGTYPKACLRKYWAMPLRNDFLHELGLRILIRKVQLIGAQYEKALMPLLSYSKDHYYRVYFTVKQGKKAVDELIQQHGQLWFCFGCRAYWLTEEEAKNHPCNSPTIHKAGPLWLGNLFDAAFVQAMEASVQKDIFSLSNSEKRWLQQLIHEAMYESKIQERRKKIGFYDLHKLAKTYKYTLPRKKVLENLLTKNDIPFTWSHTNPNGLKTMLSVKELNKLLREIEKKEA